MNHEDSGRKLLLASGKLSELLKGDWQEEVFYLMMLPIAKII